MKDNGIVIVDSVTIDADDDFTQQITVTFKMSMVMISDFTEYTPPDMKNDVAQQLGEALLTEINDMLQDQRT